MDLPRSLQALDVQPLERFFTDESVFPSPPAIRGSLFPNSGLIYGRPSAQAYSSLALGRHEAFLINPSPSMLDLLNVGYFMVPLEPRPATKSPLPYSAVALDLSRPASITPTAASAIQIASFTESASSLPLGTVVAEIDVTTRDGSTQAFPIRAGIETADWDYARKSAGQDASAPSSAIAGDQTALPPGVTVAHSFPAFWRSLGHSFDGHTYLASFAVAPNGERRDIIGVAVRALRPDARFNVERISLVDDKGTATSLAALVHKVDFQLAYMSDTVAAWKNPDALPRAFVVHAAETVDDDAAFSLMNGSSFRPDQSALLSEDIASRAGMQGLISWLDPALSESTSRLTLPTGSQTAHDAVTVTDYTPDRVSVSVSTDQPGYLLLDDSWYPGWSATIDGQPTPIYRADLLFRAVNVEPGAHSIVFQYRPLSLILGFVVSAASLLIALCALLLLRRRYI
jgi:hypothetical protein